jgi:hypothetical protein
LALPSGRDLSVNNNTSEFGQYVPFVTFDVEIAGEGQND